MTIGPVSFSGGLLTTFVAVIAMLVVGNRIGRLHKIDMERRLWIVIGVAVLAARATYVVRFADYYLASPLSILSIRDGGFSLPAGVIAAAACAAFLGWRSRAHRRPLLLAASTGGAVFALSMLAGLAWPQDGAKLPQLTLNRLEGGSLPMSALAGKPVVLNLWASWCGPCRREMPVLRQAQLDHPEITFVFVNQGEVPEAVRNYLATEKINLANVVFDPGTSMAAMLKAKGLPTTFFFDQNGTLLTRRMGEVSAATLAEQLAALHAQHPQLTVSN